MAGAGRFAGRWPAKATWPPRQGLLAGWKGLGRFWLAVLAVLGLGAGALQFLGPRATMQVASAPHGPSPTAAKEPLGNKPAGASHGGAEDAKSATADVTKPGRAEPGPVHDPDPGLMEPNPGVAHSFLPHIAADGRTPMHEYAAGFDASTRRARVGILMVGIGMSEADSTAAIHQLPAAVSLAISPYTANTDRLLASARATEHEYLLSIPMEPQGFPINDPDDRHALMTSLPPEENLTRLHWAMSRFAGYTGVTNALGQMRGERLSGMAEQFDPVLEDVAGRGLLFVDARPRQPPLRKAWNRSIDLVIDDDPMNETSVDGQLEALAKLAKDKGAALGLVTAPRPVTLDRLAAWTNTLGDRGIILAPVSALVVSPAAQEQEK